MKRILILGGTRFIGKAICRTFLEQGYEVHILHRGFHKCEATSPRIFAHHGNIHNALEYKKLLKTYSFDAIIHTIAYENKDIMPLLQILKTEKVPLITISTGQVYLVTLPPKEEYVEEDYNRLLMPAPQDEANYSQWEYGIKKRDVEDTLTQWYEDYNIPSVTIRSPVVQGNLDYSYRLYSYIARILDGNPIILPHNGNPVISHIWVEDLARAVLKIAESGPHSRLCFNVSMNERLLLKEFIQEVGNILDKPTEIYMVNEPSSQVNSVAINASPYSGGWVSVLNADRIKETYQWNPTPLHQWLHEVVTYQAGRFDPNQLSNYVHRNSEIEMLETYPDLFTRL
ncbi:MAG: hypothetical protein Kow00108_03060 [Calditrichia bacterium]